MGSFLISSFLLLNSVYQFYQKYLYLTTFLGLGHYCTVTNSKNFIQPLMCDFPYLTPSVQVSPCCITSAPRHTSGPQSFLQNPFILIFVLQRTPTMLCSKGHRPLCCTDGLYHTPLDVLKVLAVVLEEGNLTFILMYTVSL